MAETEEFPSLDFSDFCRLGSDPSWVSVQELIKQKVSREAANPSNLLANEFAHSLENYRDHPSHTKSILLFPGRWEGFSYRDAVLLGQSILSESQFSVFIAVLAAPFTTPQNAHERNPHLCGNGSFAEVEGRYLISSDVGMGQELGGEVSFGLASNQRKVFFLKLRKPVKEHHVSDMFIRPTVLDLLSYTPFPPALVPGRLTNRFFWLRWSRGRGNSLRPYPSQGSRCNPFGTLTVSALFFSTFGFFPGGQPHKRRGCRSLGPG